jgi:AcrR family transcriptional regulator
MAHRAGLDREQVLAAAAELADTKGLEGLTLGRLAQRLGIKTPSLYNHVAGLPDVQAELSLGAKRSLGAQLARAAVGKASDDAVIAVANAFRAFIKEHPARYALTVRASSADDPLAAEAKAADMEVVEIVLAVLSAYGLSGEQAVHAVRGLRSVAHGFSTLELTGGFGLPLDADESFRILCQTWVAGLRDLVKEEELDLQHARGPRNTS